MQKLSISESARQAGITRQYMHKLIKAGTVTVSTDEMGNRYVDSTELLRAFDGRLPKIKPPSTKETPVSSKELRHITPIKNAEFTGLQTEVQSLREQLADKAEQIKKGEDRERKAEDRERRLLDQIDKLTDTIKQIEYKPAPTPAVPSDREQHSWLVKLLLHKIW